MGVPTSGVVSADYKDDGQIRVATYESGQASFEVLFPPAFDKVTEMVVAQDYSRFALIRRKCETAVSRTTRMAIGASCILWAQMLREDDVAEPKGNDDEVEYYIISEAGVALPES